MPPAENLPPFFQVLGSEPVDVHTVVRHHLLVTTPLDPEGRPVDVDCPTGITQEETDARLYQVAREVLANRGGPAIPVEEPPAEEPPTEEPPAEEPPAEG